MFPSPLFDHSGTNRDTWINCQNCWLCVEVISLDRRRKLPEAVHCFDKFRGTDATPLRTQSVANRMLGRITNVHPLKQAHAALAYVHLPYDWDWATAEKEFLRSLQLNNNHPTAHHWCSHFLKAVGRDKESRAESKRALELDPLDPGISIHLAWFYYYTRQYDAVVEQSKEVNS